MLQMKNELWDEEILFFWEKRILSLGEKKVTLLFFPILCQTNETLQLILSFYF